MVLAGRYGLYGVVIIFIRNPVHALHNKVYV